MKICPTCGTTYSDDAMVCALDRTSLVSHDLDDLTGTVIAERYRILRPLGQGGMGRVYQAEHVVMGRSSAIKVINPSLSHDPEALGRFNREASSAARINHPNVCAIYDFGPTPGGPFYLAMEYIEGESLRDILERERMVPLGRAVTLTRQCADGLQAAHDLGIVHRDLKPDNIMVVPGEPESVKIVDFGVAKAFAGATAGEEVTRTGFVVGTPEYMSPEQLSGDAIDGRSDVYALAIVFYRMVTSRHPFESDTAQGMLAKRLTEAPSALAHARPDLRFPPELQAVLDQALARKAEDRFATATSFSEALLAATSSAYPGEPESASPTAATARMVGGRAVPTIPPTRIEGSEVRRGRWRRLIPISAIVVVGAVAGGLYWLRAPATSAPPGLPTGTVDDSMASATTAGPGRGDTPAVLATVDTAPAAAPPTTPPASVPGGSIPLGVELAALQDSIIEHPARRAVFRERAESIYWQRNLPDSLRVTAAWTVAHAFREERADSQALAWFRSAYDLVPVDDLERRGRLQRMIDQLQPTTP